MLLYHLGLGRPSGLSRSGFSTKICVHVSSVFLSPMVPRHSPSPKIHSLETKKLCSRYGCTDKMAGRTGDAKGKESMPQKTGNFVTG
jgi:hypothetical protein